jgi:Cu+-exporting ATPase
MLYDYLPVVILPSKSAEETKKLKVDSFEEITGKGIHAQIFGYQIQIGSASFVEKSEDNSIQQTSVHIKINGVYYGKYIFNNQYRAGLEELFKNLSSKYQIKVLSGDNEGERSTLEKLLPKGTELIFNQKPEQKLEFIKNLQEKGKNVMMVGDGLNDAGALAQSNVGISISENVNVFSPACDAILDANEFPKLDYFLKLSKNSITTIKMSFTLSLLYNVVGLSFAITGNLLPLVAAIIMPLSTVTIVSFVTAMSSYYASKK